MAKRIILISGKGGVGKTTIASATAIAAARRGHRTIVLSFDLAHSLADSFDLDRGLFCQNEGLPAQILDRLDMQEIDIHEEIGRHWGEINQYMAALFNSAGLDSVVAEEVAVMPGMEDLVALIAVNQHYKSGRYDVIVVDCPPTSESLRFVNLMTTIDWYIKKRFNFDRNLAKVARPITNRFTELNLPDDGYFAQLKESFERMEGVDRLLRDPEVTTVRLVTNAEKMVVRETQRAFTYFCMYGMTTDRVVINRLISPNEGYFSRWAETHAAYADEIEDYFKPVPVSRLPMFADEVVGLERLEELAETLFNGSDPAEGSLARPPFSFEKVDDGYLLAMSLPFVEKQEIDLSRNDLELIIRIGTFKRHIALPRSLIQLEIAEARMENNRLNVVFAD